MTHGSGAPAVSDIEQKLADLRADLVIHRNDLRNRYPTLPANDPRIVVARWIRAVVSSSYLSWIFTEDYLSKPAWWTDNFKPVPPQANIQDDLNDYTTLIAASCVVYSLSLFEAGLRRVVREIDSNACNNATAEFKSIYDWLLSRLNRSGWTFSLGNATDLLDLYRTVRNTIHNNGAFYPPRGQNITIVWRGTSYQFQHSQPPGFISWDLHIMLIRDLGQLNREIMEASLISALPPIA